MINDFLKVYERPEAEELHVMLESTILSGNMEELNDRKTEIDFEEVTQID